MPSYEIEIKGLKELRQRIKQYPKIGGKHYRKAMQKSVVLIQKGVRPLTPVFTGRLRDSIEWEIRGTGVNLVGVVGSTLKKEIYPSVMEFGRKKGAKMPPPKKLERWVQLVLKVPKNEIKGIAFVVARAIGKRGIKGKRFMQKGYNKAKSKVNKNFKKALNDVVRELAGKR
jgi:hypothetical protein